MQREHLHEMEVGDFIQLPNGDWESNKAAKAMHQAAQDLMQSHKGDGPSPQFQMNSTAFKPYTNRLERIR